MKLIAMKCGENQEYAIRKECPVTCNNIDKIDLPGYDCGALQVVEGCFCRKGFVMDTLGNCITKENCGCSLPDNSATLQVCLKKS